MGYTSKCNSATAKYDVISFHVLIYFNNDNLHKL